VTPSEFVAYASRSWDTGSRSERLGQHWFNRLYEVRPDLAETVVGTPLDPFHKDYVPAEFIAYIYEEWGESE